MRAGDALRVAPARGAADRGPGRRRRRRRRRRSRACRSGPELWQAATAARTVSASEAARRRASIEAEPTTRDAQPRYALRCATVPTKNGPILAMNSEVCRVLRIVCTRWLSGWSSLPTRPMTNSLSSASRPWHARRMSCASSCLRRRPCRSCACSRRMRALLLRLELGERAGAAERVPDVPGVAPRSSRSRSGGAGARARGRARGRCCRCGRASPNEGRSTTLARAAPSAKSGRTARTKCAGILAPREQADAARAHRVGVDDARDARARGAAPASSRADRRRRRRPRARRRRGAA